jgi:hypothetical protein
VSESVRELYPAGVFTLRQAEDLMHRHARKLESCVIQDVATNERFGELREDFGKFTGGTERKLDDFDRQLSETNKLLMEIKLAMAQGEGSTKRLAVWAALLGPIFTALLMFAVQYALKPSSPDPAPVHLTEAQKALMEQMDLDKKRYGEGSPPGETNGK